MHDLQSMFEEDRCVMQERFCANLSGIYNIPGATVTAEGICGIIPSPQSH